MLLGYKEWTWDESEVVDENEYSYENYADFKIGELLPELSATLSSPGILDNHWDFGFRYVSRLRRLKRRSRTSSGMSGFSSARWLSLSARRRGTGTRRGTRRRCGACSASASTPRRC